MKATLAPSLRLQALRRRHETQYHIHAALDVAGAAWDSAINVGTNDADDLLRYRLAYDFHHPVTAQLAAAPAGANVLTGTQALPALDFLRSDILAETGAWRPSDVMDGSWHPEPVASLMRLLQTALGESAEVYLFGRFYAEGNGIHDTHMNQGSTGAFIHTAGNDGNDHNDIWQDGALLVARPDGGWVAYFAAFEQQYLPTDELGNPAAESRPVGAAR